MNRVSAKQPHVSLFSAKGALKGYNFNNPGGSEAPLGVI